MRKAFLFIILFIFIFPIFVFYLIFYFDEKSSIEKLEKYNFKKREEKLKSMHYKKREYVITMYYDETLHTNLNILFMKKDKFYLLEHIEKCDISRDHSNMYIKNNNIYIHCIGQVGNILEYKIDDFNVEKDIRYLNYKSTPNISQLHIGIDKVNNKYIYLSSLKIDDSKEEGGRVKCNLSNNKCSYY